MTISTSSLRPDHEVTIVGSGFAGLCMAMQLARAGIENFVLLEQADEVGGTWRDNHYPGCACDIPSHLYSFSFAPNPHWSRMYADHAEIQAYLVRCSHQNGLRGKIHLRTALTEARFDEAHDLWQVTTSTGRRFSTRVLVTAMGPLSRPAIPRLPGIERFQGPAFHSARWDHGFDPQGRRVAVIGTGASAIQFVPQLQARADQVLLFQRTPPWVLPKADRPIEVTERRRMRAVPGYRRLFRYLLYWRQEASALGFLGMPSLMARAQSLATRFLKKHVKDPALRERLLPTYNMGCKRILLSNDYYPALAQPNVRVLGMDSLQGVTERGLRVDGQEVPVDAIVYGTGFRATDLLTPLRLLGRGGADLNEVWAREGLGAHNGTCVAGFPNLFMLLGPNTGLGHNSAVFMIEAQVQYVLRGLRRLRAQGATSVEVRLEAQQAFAREIATRTRGTVWKSGCHSWYLDAQGRNVTVWPGFTLSFWWRLRHFRRSEHLWGRAGAA